MSNLAIIIPAYKYLFLEETLRSLSEQRNKNFNIYIGNDASPHDIKSIVDKFRSSVNITYKEFTENLGRNDLVAHWERCIDMAGNEEWIWLFSDDDLMDPDCVQLFIHTLDNFPGHDLYHFNIKIIDDKEEIIQTPLPFPDMISSEEFINLRLNDKISTFVVEYVFRKKKFIEAGGFQHFDMAWGSDDATWIKMSIPNGIKTIPGANVYWRRSQYNISPNVTDRKILLRKSKAEIHFASWLLAFVNSGFINIEPEWLKIKLKKGFLLRLTSRSYYMTLENQILLLDHFRKLTQINTSIRDKMRLLYFKIYRTIRNFIARP